MENTWISRGGITVNLAFVTNIERSGSVLIFYGETIWADKSNGTTGWEMDDIAKFFYDSEAAAIEAELTIRRHIGAISV